MPRTLEAAERLLKEVNDLPEEIRDHFRITVAMLAACYVKKYDMSCVLLMCRNDEVTMNVLNATDMEAYEILSDGLECMETIVRQDAPDNKSDYN